MFPRSFRFFNLQFGHSAKAERPFLAVPTVIRYAAPCGKNSFNGVPLTNCRTDEHSKGDAEQRQQDEERADLMVGQVLTIELGLGERGDQIGARVLAAARLAPLRDEHGASVQRRDAEPRAAASQRVVRDGDAGLRRRARDEAVAALTSRCRPGLLLRPPGGPS